MIKPYLFQLFLLLPFLLLDANQNYSENNISNGERVPTILTEKENNQDFNLSLNSSFILKLPVQLGTGYDWYIANKLSAIELLNEFIEEEPSTNKNHKVGGETLHVFEFKIITQKEETLKLEYKRIWEKNKTGVKVFQLHIHCDVS